MSRFGLFFLYAVALTLALSYAIALALWEEFDEPFHYANVVQYSVDRSLTSLPRSRLSEEIRRSFADAPASHLVVLRIQAIKRIIRHLPICLLPSRMRFSAIRPFCSVFGFSEVLSPFPAPCCLSSH